VIEQITTSVWFLFSKKKEKKTVLRTNFSL
jgi:hypothetical protein